MRSAKQLLFSVFFCFQFHVCLPVVDWALPATELSGVGKEGDIAMNSSGDAIAVWLDDSSDQRVQARRYNRATEAWSSATYLSEAGLEADAPRVAINDSGDAIVVWESDDGSGNIVKANHYDADTDSWLNPSLAEDLSETGGFEPKVAMSSSGDAVAVWIRSDGSNDIVQANHYDAGTASWLAPASAKNLSNTGQNAERSQVAMNDSGDAVAVWQRSDGSNKIIQANHYDAGTTSWLSPASSKNLSETGQDAEEPQVAMNSSGDAVAVWIRSDGSDDIVQANHYDAGTTSWLSPASAKNLSEAGQDAEKLDVAINDPGQAVAVWGRNSVVQANHYDGVSWLDPSLAKNISDGTQNASTPYVAINKSGNAVAGWTEIVGTDASVYASSYDADTQEWLSAKVLSASGQKAGLDKVALNDSGQTIVLFQEIPQGVFATAGNITSFLISNLVATKKTRRSPTQVDLIHVLSWDAVERATKYRIYVDANLSNLAIDVSDNSKVASSLSSGLGVLVGEIAASENPSFEHHGRCPGKTVTYHVASVDGNGDNGSVSSITV